MPVYEVKPETGNGRSRVLHRNLLLPCSHLPVETQLKSSKSRRAVSRIYGSTGYHAEDNCGIIPELVERDIGTGTEQDPCQDDGPSLEEEVEDQEQLDNMADDETADGLPLRQSQRLSRPPLRMTYNAMGQPSFQPSSTAGIQGIAVSYPQQLWQPVTVPWMLQPVLQPYSYFVPFPVPVQPMYQMPTCCY